jgi:uncharacterized lipoprotein YehR (DUF1307 family)
MKHLRKRLVLSLGMVLMLVFLTSCGGGKEQTATFLMDNSDTMGVHVEMVVNAKGDKIMDITQTSVMKLEMYPEEQIEQLRMMSAMIEETCNEIDGATYTVTETEEEYKEVVELNVGNKDTLKAIVEAELLPVEGGTDQLSFKGTKENLVDYGWVLEE